MPYKDKSKQKEAQRQYYVKYKSRVDESRLRNREKRDQWFKKIKEKLFCKQCGFSDYRCLDFHHRDQNEKEFGVSEGVKLALSEERILIEISKCDVLCANCHIKHHTSDKKIFHRKAVTNNITWLRSYKNNLSCVDCGLNDGSVLVFHHIGIKTDAISNMVYGGCSIKKLLEEISKCEAICSNCHRIRHNGNIWESNSLEK